MGIQQQQKERGAVTRLLGLSVAAVTMMAAFLVAPAAHADTYTNTADPDTSDDFYSTPTELNQSRVPHLTVIKYLSNGQFGDPTGSVNDKPAGKTPAAGALFEIREVQSASGDPNTMNASDSTTYTTVTGGFWAAGITDSTGKIKNDAWKVASGTVGSKPTIATGAAQANFAAINVTTTAPKYYLIYDWTSTGNPSNKPAVPSIVSLPYRAVNHTTASGDVTGYVFSLHIYPKSESNGKLFKSVSGITRRDGTAVPAADLANAVVQAGDTVQYTIRQGLGTSEVPTGVNKDGNLDLDEINHSSGNYLRVVDRLSSAFDASTTTASAELQYKKNTADQTPVPLGTTEFTATDAAVDPTSHKPAEPTRIYPSVTTDEMFKPVAGADNRLHLASAGTNYKVMDFTAGSTTIGNLTTAAGALSDVQDPVLVITLTTKITAKGDSEAGKVGFLTNFAVSDNIDALVGTNTDPEPVATAFADVASAGVQFVKTTKKDVYTSAEATTVGLNNVGKNKQPLTGAVYRVVKASANTTYLCGDGTFQSTDAAATTHGGYVEATSNAQGIVTMTGLPILGATNTAAVDDTTANGLQLVEYKAPTNYVAASGLFTIKFGTTVGMTESAIVSGGHTVGQPDFAQWKGNAPTTQIDASTGAVTWASPFRDVEGNDINSVMINWGTDDNNPNRPIGLPITGGQGIVLLLVIGAAIMAGAAWARSRRNRAASYSI